MFLLCMLIIMEDGMPAIFVQKRLGKGKAVFRLLKIRTMKNNTIEVGTHDIESSRVLRVGKVIRRLKLDEFLQLINVLQGKLNLVGPRPSLQSQTELMKERDKLNIFSVEPGITGLAQVCGYDMRNPHSLAYVDSLYLKNRSMSLDAKILIATFTGIFKKNLKLKFKI